MLHTVLGHCDFDSGPQNLKTSYPQHVSPIFFEATISIFVWMHQDARDCSVLLWAKVTLTSVV